MVSDREPRYQLLDSNGTVVGSLYEKSNGKLALQDGNTDTEVVFDGDTIGSGGESLDIDSLTSRLKVLDLVDDSSGNTVYDSSSETLGDGNQDVQADSVSTADAQNSDIGDGVDYLDPTWLVRSEAVFYFYQPESIGNDTQTTNGSGSISYNGSEVVVETGSTSNSQARYKRTPNGFGSFDNNYELLLRCAIDDTTTDQTFYATFGGVSQGNNGFGIKIDGGALQAVVHNGSTETTATIETLSGSFVGITVEIDYTGGSELVVTRRQSGQSGTISSNLPSGFDPNVLVFEANNSSANNRTIRGKDSIILEEP